MFTVRDYDDLVTYSPWINEVLDARFHSEPSKETLFSMADHLEGQIDAIETEVYAITPSGMRRLFLGRVRLDFNDRSVTVGIVPWESMDAIPKLAIYGAVFRMVRSSLIASSDLEVVCTFMSEFNFISVSDQDLYREHVYQKKKPLLDDRKPNPTILTQFDGRSIFERFKKIMGVRG